jgi:hypothetical protein
MIAGREHLEPRPGRQRTKLQQFRNGKLFVRQHEAEHAFPQPADFARPGLLGLLRPGWPDAESCRSGRQRRPFQQASPNRG